VADIQMPQLGETVTEGTITKWFKAVGDAVTEDEPLFEVSTDKVDSEVPSPTNGFLSEIKVEEGETVDVGTVLAVVSDQPGGEATADAATPEQAADTAPPEAGSGGDGGTALEEEATEQAHAEEQAADAPAPDAAETSATPAPDEQEAPAATAEPEPASSAAAQANGGGAEAPTSTSAVGGLVLSPVVRRLISEHHLDPAAIQGTGTGGRITRADVLRVVEGETGQPATLAPAAATTPTATPEAPAPATTPPTAPAARSAPAAVGSPKPGADDTVVALNNIRRRTGEHMVRSKATSPHVLTVMEVDFEAVEQARRAHKESFKAQEGFSLTYLPFIARALIDGLGEFPHMNATVGEGELIVHHDVNLGIAVDLDYEGLIVPVIHDAQDKRLRAIARSISDLAGRARGKKLSADDITGGTVTITNAGQYGTAIQMAVINQPQVMILSTEGVTRKPVVVTDGAGNEAIAIHSMGNLSMTWDHRAFDGAYAAAFLRRVSEILETRDWSSEL